MAKPFGSQVDFQKIPSLGFVVYSNATAPPSPVQGQLWVDTSVTPVLKVYISGGWVQADNTGVSLTGHTHIIGDVTGLQAALDAKAAASRLISSGLGLTGGGDLTVDRTLVVDFAASGVSSATKAVRADDTRLSDSRPPTGSIASGSLAGSTYPNPTIAASAITGTEISATIKDPVAGTAGLRTLGYTGNAAMPGIARLDQISAPTAAVPMNAQKITGLADPTNAQDAATKAYVDAARQGLDTKDSVRAASTANVVVTYSATGGTSGRGQITVAPNTLDGVTLAAGNRVLLKDQTTAAQNGIWTVTTLGTGANGVWDRATDFDADAEVTSGAYVFVEEGTVNDNSGWVVTTANPIVIGGASGTALAFTQFTGAGQITAGNGLTKTANTLDVNVDNSSIEINIDILRVKALGITNAMLAGSIDLTTKVTGALPIANGGTGAITAAAARTALSATGKYAATLGALTAGVETIVNHALNSSDVWAAFREVSTGKDLLVDWRVIDANNVGVTADIAYAASALRATVIG